LDGSEDYRACSLLFDMAWDVTEPLGLGRWSERVQLEAVLEPYLVDILEPRDNLGLGANALVKVTWVLDEDYSPYVKAGVGVDYMTLHTLEQSTQWNFGSQVGVGLEIPVADGIDFDLEYRIKHVSNASVRHPNSGIDSTAFLVGLRMEPKLLR